VETRKASRVSASTTTRDGLTLSLLTPATVRAYQNQTYSMLFENKTQAPIAFEPAAWTIVWAGVDVLVASVPIEANVTRPPQKIGPGQSIEMTYTVRLDSGRWKIAPSFSGGHDELREAEITVDTQ
jgi:hypothetical protein